METWDFSGSVTSVIFFLSHKWYLFFLIWKKKPRKEKILVFPLLQISRKEVGQSGKEVLSFRGIYFSDNSLWAFWRQHSKHITPKLVYSFLPFLFLLLRASTGVFIVPKSMMRPLICFPSTPQNYVNLMCWWEYFCIGVLHGKKRKNNFFFPSRLKPAIKKQKRSSPWSIQTAQH